MSLLQNPHPSGDQLNADFAVVSEAQLGSARLDAARALLGRTGCLGDALTYYQGVDPAHEVDHAYFDGLSVKEQRQEMVERAITGVHAAEILVGSIVHPGFYDQRHSRRVRKLSKEASWYKVLDPKSRGMTTPYDNIGLMLDEIHEHVLTTENATTLSMSAEMLSSALTWWQLTKMDAYKTSKEDFIKDDKLRGIFDSQESAIITCALAVQGMVKLKTIDETMVGIPPEERLERSALGLKAQWRSASALMNPAFRYGLPEQAIAVLSGMVDSIRKEFIEGDLLNTKIHPKKEIKGLLHELMWLLDAEMLMMANPDDYKTIHVGPSAARLDRPVIGRPTYLRGIDYAIADVDKDDSQTQLINLKSGNGFDKEYHPRIKLIKERNFQDLNRGRLINKLRQYEAIIHTGFQSPDARAIVEEYALESVIKELSLHKNPSTSEGWPYLVPPTEDS